MNLDGIDGNAFAIIGAFKREAKRQGRDERDIEAVVKDAMSGDYNHLIEVMVSFTEPY